MDPHRFVISDERDRETIKDVTCALCKKVAERPTNCRHHHVFCYSCIESQLATYPACPVDGASMSVSDLLVNKFMERTLSLLVVRCENRDAGGSTTMVRAIRKRLPHPVGCRWEGTLRDLKKHKDSCQFRCVPCHNCNRNDIPLVGMAAHLRECVDRYTKCDMCDAEIMFRALQDHMENCPAASVYCPNHCLLRPGETTDVRMLQRKDIEEHLAKCPRQIIDCEFRDVGCEVRCRREMMQEHLEAAIHEHVAAVRNGLVEVRKYLGMKPRSVCLDNPNARIGSRAGSEADGAMKDIGDVRDAQ